MDEVGSVRKEDGYAVIRVPMRDVQGLRVALAECPCRAVKSTDTANFRIRLSMALGRLISTNHSR